VSLFLVLSSIIALINYIIFAKGIISGRIKPHRTTRFVLMLITVIMTLSLFFQHNTTSIYLTGSFMIGNFFIFTLSIKHGMGGWSKTDLTCLLFALIGIFLWLSTNNPVFALYASIMADFTCMIPTFIKTYHYPNTEYWLTYFVDTIAGILNILANKTFNFNIIIFPIYLIFINTVMISIIYRKSFKEGYL
jgi:hypothetical protein